MGTKNLTPLVVDLDGTFITTDSLQELLIASLRHPRVFIRSIFFLLLGKKAKAKQFLSKNVVVKTELFPVNRSLYVFLKSEAKTGRKIYLATGADSSIANQFKADYPIFSAVFSSDGQVNLTGENKAEKLVAEFGNHKFDYVGNSKIDIKIWEKSNKKFLAAATRISTSKKKFAEIPLSDTFISNNNSVFYAWMKELRWHQSLKNLLLFLPLLAAHEIFNFESWAKLSVAFISFSFIAFSVYLMNDLADLNSDRIHTDKRKRPLASGQILPLNALFLSFGLLFLGFIIGWSLGVLFQSILLLYFLITLFYTLLLKKIVLIDVITLGFLYMLRIFAGAAVTEIQMTFWFTAVTMFLFLSLALVKRHSELKHLESLGEIEKIPGRGYQLADIQVVLTLGLASGIASVLLLSIYIQSPAVSLLYQNPTILWLAIPIFFYWVALIWLTSSRGKMRDDPVIFALKNFSSLTSGLLLLCVFFIATISK